MSDLLSLNKRQGWLVWQTRLGEILRSIAAYLGVAVLVAVVMVVSVPSLRGQASVLHQAILTAMIPDGAFLGPGGTIDPVVSPQVNPINLSGIPARMLARPRPPAEPVVETPVEKTEPLGLLGNTRVDEIEAAMKHFGLSQKQLDALESYIARKYWVSKAVVQRLIETVLIVGGDFDINPVLLLAVMSIESRFNPYAESGAGAQGLMQVMTRVHLDKFERLGQGGEAAFHPKHNIRVGAQILNDCITRRGSVTNGLKCYVGATTSDDGGYSSKVLAEQRRMALAANIALPR